MNSTRKLPRYDSAQQTFPLLRKLNELIRYRYLVANLISRDLKVRYKRSVIGFVWTMLNPLITMGTLVIVFSSIFHSEIKHFPTYVLAGLLIWNVFSQGSVAAMNSLLGNSATLRKIYVPPSAFVFSAVGSAFTNLAFALIPFFILTLIDGLRPQIGWLYLLLPIAQVFMLTAGVGLIVAAMVVFFADVLEIYQVLLNIFFFLTPIMYPISILPPQMVILERFNPVNYIVETFRLIIIDNTPPPIELVAVSTLASFAFLLLGWLIFTRQESKFAYYV